MVGRKVRLQLDKAPAHAGRRLLTVAHLCPASTRAACARWTMSSFSIARRRDRRHRRRLAATARASCWRCWPASARPSGGGFVVRRPARSRRASLRTRPRCARLGARPCARGPPCASGWWRLSGLRNRRMLGYQRRRRPMRAGWLLDRGAVERHCAALMERLRRAAARARLCARRISPAATSRSWCWRARWRAQPKVLLVGQPTRGVDIGAIEFIHRQLLAQPRRGLRPSCWSRSSSTRSWRSPTASW